MNTNLLKPFVVSSANKLILAWFGVEGRDLPWRTTRNPYSILISEIMLQQTQVNRVIPFYDRFLELFPNFDSLAKAPLREVIRAWSGLGYNRRAVNLQSIAQFVVSSLNGELPRTIECLMKFKGIGPYTAAAICCFAFNGSVPVLDTNTKRVLSRLIFGLKTPSLNELTSVAYQMLPEDKAWGWNQGLMDLGAMVCLPNEPKCKLCPVQGICEASKQRVNGLLEKSKRSNPLHFAGEPFGKSRRYFRGRILALLSQLDDQETIQITKLGEWLQPGVSADNHPWLLELLRQLGDEGLLMFSNDSKDVSLPLGS